MMAASSDASKIHDKQQDFEKYVNYLSVTKSY